MHLPRHSLLVGHGSLYRLASTLFDAEMSPRVGGWWCGVKCETGGGSVFVAEDAAQRSTCVIPNRNKREFHTIDDGIHCCGGDCLSRAERYRCATCAALPSQLAHLEAKKPRKTEEPKIEAEAVASQL